MIETERGVLGRRVELVGHARGVRVTHLAGDEPLHDRPRLVDQIEVVRAGEVLDVAVPVAEAGEGIRGAPAGGRGGRVETRVAGDRGVEEVADVADARGRRGGAVGDGGGDLVRVERHQAVRLRATARHAGVDHPVRVPGDAVAVPEGREDVAHVALLVVRPEGTGAGLATLQRAGYHQVELVGDRLDVLGAERRIAPDVGAMLRRRVLDAERPDVLIAVEAMVEEHEAARLLGARPVVARQEQHGRLGRTLVDVIDGAEPRGIGFFALAIAERDRLVLDVAETGRGGGRIGGSRVELRELDVGEILRDVVAREILGLLRLPPPRVRLPGAEEEVVEVREERAADRGDGDGAGGRRLDRTPALGAAVPEARAHVVAPDGAFVPRRAGDRDLDEILVEVGGDGHRGGGDGGAGRVVGDQLRSRPPDGEEVIVAELSPHVRAARPLGSAGRVVAVGIDADADHGVVGVAQRPEADQVVDLRGVGGDPELEDVGDIVVAEEVLLRVGAARRIGKVAAVPPAGVQVVPGRAEARARRVIGAHPDGAGDGVPGIHLAALDRVEIGAGVVMNVIGVDELAGAVGRLARDVAGRPHPIAVVAVHLVSRRTGRGDLRSRPAQHEGNPCERATPHR